MFPKNKEIFSNKKATLFQKAIIATTPAENSMNEETSLSSLLNFLISSSNGGR